VVRGEVRGGAVHFHTLDSDNEVVIRGFISKTFVEEQMNAAWRRYWTMHVDDPLVCKLSAVLTGDGTLKRLDPLDGVPYNEWRVEDLSSEHLSNIESLGLINEVQLYRRNSTKPSFWWTISRQCKRTM